MIKPVSLTYIFAVAFLASPGCFAEQKSVELGRFSSDDLQGWEEKSFKGHTLYTLSKDRERGNTVLRAHAQGTASGLFRKTRIDLRKTPVLNWAWKIDRPYAGTDEKRKRGDDFPVRLYVIVENGWLGLSTQAINYVWAGTEGTGSSWPNPFTRQAHMLAVDSGAAQSGKWVAHKRNVREDLKAAFGEEFTEVHAIAVMTDGDNSSREAMAWYGDIYFSER